MADYKSLGLLPMPEHTIEHDFAMLTKFQEFSAELLRLALLGISAIALAVSKWLFSKSDEMTLAAAHLAVARPWLILALVAFSIAAFAALYHRYASADSMSWHLQAMRRFQSGEPDQIVKARNESAQRFRRFKWSQNALRISTVTLGLGASALAIAVIAATASGSSAAIGH
jgi:hypothetical protein